MNIAVIGAGIFGLSIAYRLAKMGMSVSVYEAAGKPATGATGAAAGMLCPDIESLSYQLPAHDRVKLQAARTLWDGWADEIGVPLEASGALWVTDENINGLRAVDAQSIEPGCGGRLAYMFPDDRRVNPQWMCQRLVRCCTALGVVFHFNSAATCHVNGQQAGVQLATGDTHVFDKIICSSISDNSIKNNNFKKISHVKGQACVVAVSRAPNWILRGDDVYVCPLPDGGCYVGATMQFGVSDLVPDQDVTDDLVKRASYLWPALAGGQVVKSVVGLRPFVRGHIPYIQQNDDQSLIVASGGYRHGILLSPWVADRVADMVATGSVANHINKPEHA